jgi:hypothetical protein
MTWNGPIYRPFCLGGLPPLRCFRFACSFLKYSDPRLAIFLPPLRPSSTAAGSFFRGIVRYTELTLEKESKALPEYSVVRAQERYFRLTMWCELDQ